MNSYRLLFESEYEDVVEKLKIERDQKITGYYDLPFEPVKLPEKKDFHEIVLIGIGGSSLGTRAIDSFLRLKRKAKKIHYLDNPDPVAFKNKLSKIVPSQSLFILISKSGTTLETITQFKALLHYFNLDLSQDAKRFIFITDKDSALDKLAKKFAIECFYIPKNVGGRFSVLSSVGMIPLGLAGYEIEKILYGAKFFMQRFFTKKETTLLKKASFLAKNWQKYPMNVLFSYANELENFNKWYMQLWGESLGKIDANGQSVGLTPITLIGPRDQHSFLQLLAQGPIDKSVTFLRIANFEEDLLIPNCSLPYLESTDFINGLTFGQMVNEQAKATMKSLKKRGMPIDEIILPCINEESIGELIVYFELLTSSVGALLEINTYDQPGVEEGKKILRQTIG